MGCFLVCRDISINIISIGSLPRRCEGGGVEEDGRCLNNMEVAPRPNNFIPIRIYRQQVPLTFLNNLRLCSCRDVDPRPEAGKVEAG